MIGQLLVRVASIASAMGAVAIAAIPDPSDAVTVADLITKGVIVLAFAAIAYLLNDTLKTIKETKKESAENAKLLAMHHIMFEQWLDELTEGQHETKHPHRRKSDVLLEVITQHRKDK